MPPEGDGFDAPLLEGLLWAVALVWAVVRVCRTPREQRPGWLLVATGLLLIVLDKAVDVHAVLHAAGRWLAVTIDPEHQLRGPHAVHRNVALLCGLCGGCVAVAWWLRRDAHVGRAKLCCLGGLLLVAALLAARLMPQFEELLPDWLTKGVELAAWLLVLCGLSLAGRRPRGPGLEDGFV